MMLPKIKRNREILDSIVIDMQKFHYIEHVEDTRDDQNAVDCFEEYSPLFS